MVETTYGLQVTAFLLQKKVIGLEKSEIKNM